ncbi:MAG TPA: DUF883 family protein [Burkholderiales bacterium]|nr:DUF883 family protein [Burkholderiales bacterium]
METAKGMMDELRTALADAEELLRVTAGEAGPKIQEARRRAEESLRGVREQMEGAGRDLDAKVRENPWAAVGVAVGIGLIAGILLSRKP